MLSSSGGKSLTTRMEGVRRYVLGLCECTHKVALAADDRGILRRSAPGGKEQSFGLRLWREHMRSHEQDCGISCAWMTKTAGWRNKNCAIFFPFPLPARPNDTQLDVPCSPTVEQFTFQCSQKIYLSATADGRQESGGK